MRPKLDICYLCGQQVLRFWYTRDHVPPKHFYSKEIRKSRGFAPLLTLRTHGKCNESYRLDEEYFVHTFAVMAYDSYAGGTLWNEIRDQYLAGKNLPLRKKALSEFDLRPSGIVLPGGKVLKRFDPQRIWRVVWKITRGLFFDKYEIVLPENTPRVFFITEPGEPPPGWFGFIASQPGGGKYPSAFDFKFRRDEYADHPKILHSWAMLFWDRLIMTTIFHDPKCNCKECLSKSVAP